MEKPMQKRTPPSGGGIPISEWIAASVGVVLVAASIAILVHSAMTSPDSAPRLSMRVASIEKAGEEFLVIIEVGNEGGSTAADARIMAELRVDGVAVEHSETTIDFVPPKSTRRAGVLFSREPRADQLTMRVSGYREP
jgi:uncharacterized protein (TIGR02588 family)